MTRAALLAATIEVPMETVERARHARVLQDALVDQLRANALLCLELENARHLLAEAQGLLALADRAGREAIADAVEDRLGDRLARVSQDEGSLAAHLSAGGRP